MRKATLTAEKVSVPDAAPWKTKTANHKKPGLSAARVANKRKPTTLAEMNAVLAATRLKRIADAEKNTMKIVGRTRL
jgi:hypothetical protein